MTHNNRIKGHITIVYLYGVQCDFSKCIQAAVIRSEELVYHHLKHLLFLCVGDIKILLY